MTRLLSKGSFIRIDMEQAPFVDAVRLAGQFGLTVDLCVRSHQIAEVTKLAELCPEVIFVLDHLGKPDVRAGGWESWAEAIRRLADTP